ncbi:hypothetical protein HMPREF9343_01220 [Cutibacterium acnes HL099PA1]|nr:hypothetical protein HMPREF9609_00185 [Cutibacterium acnes HL027PA1]EGF74608.1 hypothetical protein HMPREF9343_01220 [Cutibacterium acnes HL099PA1]
MVLSIEAMCWDRQQLEGNRSVCLLHLLERFGVNECKILGNRSCSPVAVPLWSC